MEIKSKSQSELDFVTPFLVIKYLQSLNISQEVTQTLKQELTNKGCFKALPWVSNPKKRAKVEDIDSQIGQVPERSLSTIVCTYTDRIMKQYTFQKNKSKLVEELRAKYKDYLDGPKKSLHSRFQQRANRLASQPANMFNKMIFTEPWIKFKTFFGHKKAEIDPEDNLPTSSIYNLVYNNAGTQLITAGDDGLIKIWSTVDGRLLDTLRGHKQDINAIALSPCGKYLASCANDMTVFVWSLEKKRPIAVFRDHTKSICSVGFHKEKYQNEKGETLERCLIASVGEDSTLRIYREEDFINNEGMLIRPQKHHELKLETNSNKGFSCVNFHPEGFIAVGTGCGEVVIWNKLQDHAFYSEKNRIILHEHRKDCHLVRWNDLGTMLFTASFDGTARIWAWDSSDFQKNRGICSIYVFKSDLESNRFQLNSDLRCCTVTWSCKSRYAIASFSKKESQSSKVSSNVQIYDTILQQLIHKLGKINNDNELQNFIYVIEPHPFNESIICMADYDGKVVIWDIEFGVALNYFVENCIHIGFPLCNSTVLDGRFSPDGLSFAVATYYGTFSMYGYGNDDLFVPTPREQFFKFEYDKFEIEENSYRILDPKTKEELHTVEKGPLCNSTGVAYTDSAANQETNLPFEDRYYKRYKKAEEREKLQGNIRDSNSKECIASIPRAINKLIQKDAEQLMEHLKLNYKGKLSAVDCEINMKDLFMITGDGTYIASNTKSVRAIEPARKIQIDEEEPANEPVEDQEDSDFDIPNDDFEDFSAPQPYALRARRKTRRAIQLDEMDVEEEEESAPSQQQYHTRSRDERANARERHEQQANVNVRTRGRRMRIRFDDDDDNYNNINGGGGSAQEETKVQQNAVPQSSNRFIRATVNPNTRLYARPSTTEAADSNQQTEELPNGEQVVARRRPLRPQPLQREALRNEVVMDVEDPSRSSRRPALLEEVDDLRATRRRTLRQQPVYRDLTIENEEPVRTTRRTALLNEFDTNTIDRLDPLAANVALTQCSRCLDENARVKCENCAKCYHQKCAKLRGSQTAINIMRSSFLCFECQYKNRKNKKEISNYTQVARTWPSYDTSETVFYAPQAGDKVYYVFQAHEEFISRYFSNLNFDEPEEVSPFEQFPELKSDIECEITTIRYEFPISVKRVKSSEIQCIVCVLTLNIPQTGNTFKVRYFPTEGNDSLQFLILKNKYERAMALFKGIRINTTLQVLYNGESKKLFVSDITLKESNQFFITNYKIIKVHDLNESSYHLRHARAEDMEGAVDSISPWDLLNNVPLHEIFEVTQEMNESFSERLAKDIQRLCEENSIFEPFYDEVDQKVYTDYELFVPFPMSVSKILLRIRNNFYRSKLAIISDAQLIAYNASLYNLPDSEITMNGNILSENIQNILLGNYEKTLLNIVPDRSERVGTRTRSRHQAGSQPMQNTMTRPQRNSMRIEEDDEEPIKARERRVSARPIVHDEEDYIIDTQYDSDFKETKQVDINQLENLGGRRLTRSAINHSNPKLQENRVNTRELANTANTRESIRESLQDLTHVQDEMPMFSKTRNGRTLAPGNGLRHTGSNRNRTTFEVQENSRQLSHTTKNEIKPLLQQIDSPENNGMYQRKLRTRKSESMKLIDYNLDDFEEDEDNLKYEYNEATRKKVKTNQDAQDQEGEERWGFLNGFDKEIAESQEQVGRATRASLRLKKNTSSQEEKRPPNIKDQPENNPLEQNLGGVRTRGSLTKGASLR